MERCSVHTTENFDVLRRQLERSGLETNITWCVAEDEPEINVDEVTLPVEEDIAIVSILDLQEKRDDGVASKGFCKVALGAGKFSGGWVAVGLCIQD